MYICSFKFIMKCKKNYYVSILFRNFEPTKGFFMPFSPVRSN